MAEKSKRTTSSTSKKAISESRGVARSKKSFPLWIPIAIVLGLIGAYLLMKNMSGSNSASTGNFKKVSGDVDSTDLDQWSYANGFAIGTDIKNSTDQLDEANKVNQAVVAQGVSDALLGVEAKLTEEQIQQIYTERQEGFLAENAEAGAAFLEEFKKGEGVTTQENGVAYKVINEGSGATVGKDIALVAYTGKKIDGTVFDSSEKNGGQPVPFSSSAVIPGLGSILEQMSIGAKYEIVIPSELAYGQQGIQGVIDPNETLVFDIEIMDIQEAPVQETPPVAQEEAVESENVESVESEDESPQEDSEEDN